MISLIVAIDKNNLIGKDNKLPWHLPEDLKYFKSVTSNSTLVMGRKTFSSLPGVLPDRKHIVLSRQGITYKHPRVWSYSSINDVLTNHKDENIFIIGGSEIFKEFMPHIDKMYVTYIDEEFEGDIYFPEIDEKIWQMKSSLKGLKDEKNPYDYYFRLYERV